MSVLGCRMASPQDVTQLLIKWSEGSQEALEQLMPLVYAELHRMASRYMATQPPDHTLQTTALIHEAYLRLTRDTDQHWENRAHFFRVAAKSMRQILVDHARGQLAAKRGGKHQELPLDQAIIISGERMASMLALDDALTDLAKLNPRQTEVVELRYFAGFNVEETADALKVSPETVMRDWRAARAWLHIQLSQREAASQHTAGTP
jgi:RNA polymerase sigma factor (TIGR02999 family)